MAKNDVKENEPKKYQYSGSVIVPRPKVDNKHDHSVIITDQDNNAVVVDLKVHFGKYKAEMFEPQTYKELGLDPERVFIRDHSLTNQMAVEDAVVGDVDTID